MISANTIFHFTNSLENVRNILTNNFSPRYCLEKLDFISQNEKIEIAIPMICFCDIPLSQISDHVNSYGEYAIGLNKDWAIANGISPVFYIYNNSRTSKMIIRLSKSSNRLDKVMQLVKKDTSIPATMEYLEFLFYCKIYKGSMWREGKLKKNITFYNEREWRYVPKLDELIEINPRLIINKEEHNDKEKRMKLNNQLSHIQVKFTPKDIKYIIISKENERIQMVNMIEQIKGNDFSHNDIRELNSKIISVEQIKEDF